MKKNLPILFFLVFISTFSQAQIKKMIVGVYTFSTSVESIHASKFLGSITERVVNDLKSTNRVNVIDLTSESARNTAILKAQDNYKAENWIESGKALNAEYVLTGDLGHVKFIKITSSQPNGYKASLSYTVKLIKTETGEIISAQTIDSYDSEIALTPETAFQKSFETTEGKLVEYFLKIFPVKLKVARIEKEKNGKAQEVILQGGSTSGVIAGQLYTVSKIDRSLGSPLPVKIGVIKVLNVINENFSQCKVIEGNKELYDGFTNKDEIECLLTN